MGYEGAFVCPKDFFLPFWSQIARTDLEVVWSNPLNEMKNCLNTCYF